MSDPFYGREREVRRQQEQRAHRNSHTTMETVHLERESAYDAVLDASEKSLVGRIKRALRKLTGR